MKTLLLAALIFTVTASYSQSVNNVPIKNIDVEYVEIVGTTQLGNKIKVELDFGQQQKIFSNRDTRVRDENGKDIKFNSMVDAMNFMSKNGYEFVQAYAMVEGTGRVYHYLLRKRK